MILKIEKKRKTLSNDSISVVDCLVYYNCKGTRKINYLPLHDYFLIFFDSVQRCYACMWHWEQILLSFNS